MQATLLGLAIAAILALIAALVGPFFIDWNQFRPQFEAEAARAIGAPVRVSGDLDARLLPTPTLRLRQVVVGGANDPGRVRADQLDVEFSLGSLLRGEVRANELSIGGFALDLGLDAQGRLDGQGATALAQLGALTIDRLNLTGRIALHDARSRSVLELNDIAFSGDVRAPAGAIRGDGNFLSEGARYPFRLSVSRAPEARATRLRLSLEPGQQPLTAELDGLLSIEDRTPRFDGALTLAHGVVKSSAADDRATPWRLAGKVKADAMGARIEQVDVNIGADAAALRFAGSAEAQFGGSPQLRAALTARQLDLDRLLMASGDADKRWLPALRSAVMSIPHAMLPTRLNLAVEQITLGGRAVQNIAAELRSRHDGWAVDHLALRAPGGTTMTIDEASLQTGDTGEIKAMLTLESADADLLAAWLASRKEPAGREARRLRAQGRIVLASERLSIEQLDAELDGGKIQGALSLTHASSVSRAEATLSAERLDLDRAIAWLRSLAGAQSDWPAEAILSLDVGDAQWMGQTLRPLQLQLGYGPERLTLQRLAGGEARSLQVEATGALDRSRGVGQFEAHIAATSLDRVADWIAPLAPVLAARLKAAKAREGATSLSLFSQLTEQDANAAKRTAQATLSLDAPQLKGRAQINLSPPLAAVRDLDFDAVMHSEANAGVALSSEPGAPLLATLALDSAVAASGPLRFEAHATGAWRAPWRGTARLRGDDIDAELTGTAEPWGAEPKATADLKIRRATPAPPMGRDPISGQIPRINLNARLSVAGRRLSFDDIEAAVAGARLRGRVALTRGTDTEVDGELGLDQIKLGPVLGVLLGEGSDPTAPLTGGVVQGWRGRLAFQALRGELPAGLELRPFGGVIRGDGNSLALDKLEGGIGGGEAKGDVTARLSTEGLALDARLRWSGVDGAALRYRGLQMPVGKSAMQMTLASTGRSAAALAANLGGGGVLTLDRSRIAGLDPAAFTAALRASDAGQPLDDQKLGLIVAPVLAQGALTVAKAQIPFAIEQGRLRISPTELDGEGARLVVSGGYDIAADQADLRAIMTAEGLGASAFRPELQVFAAGSPDKIERQLDVAALSSWLSTRRIDADIQKLQALERGEKVPLGPADSVDPSSDQPLSAIPLPERDPRDASPKPPRSAPPQAAHESTVTGQAAPLPPPITVRPAPGDAKPKLRPPLVLTPPTANPPRAAF